ncbi:hypothetical protein [Thermoleptolyngbya sp. C42_A2020_037]|nr:hypothetical protein [Thermoleptolyngbya sp. C42_A2020_037]
MSRPSELKKVSNTGWLSGSYTEVQPAKPETNGSRSPVGRSPFTVHPQT